MPAGSSSALALAARLRALDDDALTRLVADREVREQGIRDFFDLAEALLDRGSIQSALQRLDRPTVSLLAVAGDLATTSGAPTAGALAERLGISIPEVERRAAISLQLGLLGEESGRFAPWDAVVDQLRSWPAFGLPTVTELLETQPPAALEPVSESDARFVDRGASDRAFSTVTAITELVLVLRDEPARQLARGGIGLPDARRLGATTGIESEELTRLIEIAARVGLLATESGDLTATEAGRAWIAMPRIERWAVLASGWLDRLPDDLRALLHQRAHAVWGEGLLDYLAWLYPAGGSWMRERAASAAREAELIGITGGSTPSTPGGALLADGIQAATTAMAELFPHEVDRVYVQHDLSIVAPGPLVAEVDARLRGMADIEARGLASSYRVTGASLTRALIAGDSADGIRSFLESISLTGMPQPLEYLLRDTAARFGSLRVGSIEGDHPDGPDAGSHSYVRSEDAALLHQLEVDQALAALVLRRSGEHRIVSRFAPEVLYWTLADARYPVVAEDEEGRVLSLRRERRVVGGSVSTPDPAASLIARIRAAAMAAPEETGQAWMARQLELAIKTKMTVTVVVRMPDGSEIDYLLEPAALASGRLRARDRRSDIERTLPLSHIVEVHPA
jgi:hypothetical protein